MALAPDEVRRIAALARLQFGPDEEARYAEQLGSILSYIDQLGRFAQAAEETAPAAASAGGSLAPERLLASEFAPLSSAPEALDVYFLVPQVKVTGDG